MALMPLLHSTFFRCASQAALTGNEDNTSFSLAGSAATTETNVPVISQGDHPITGRPAFFIHPCETQTFLEEVRKSQPGQHVEPLETWLMLIHMSIDLEGM